MYITRKFSAAHHLPGYEGQCARKHGHTWKVEVKIIGFVQLKTGMVVDFKLVKDVIDTLDHGYLNDIINNPTAENICTYLVTRINVVLPLGSYVSMLRIWESEDCYVEYNL